MNSCNKRWTPNFLKVLTKPKNLNLLETSSTLLSADSKIATLFKPKPKSTQNKPQPAQPLVNQRKRKMLRTSMTGLQDMVTTSQLTMLNMENTKLKVQPHQISLKLQAQPLKNQRKLKTQRTLMTGLQDMETMFQHTMLNTENTKPKVQQPLTLLKRKMRKNQALLPKFHQKRKRESPPILRSKLLLISKEKKLIN